jgi:hypothetical protein
MGRDAAKVAGEGSIPSGGTPRAELATIGMTPTICRCTLRPPFLRHRLGRVWPPKPVPQCSIHWWRASPDRLRTVGPPCGVTAAG